MAELIKSKRIAFPSGRQNRFILVSKRDLDLTHQELAGLLNVSVRTIIDWQREKFNMSLVAANLLSQKTGKNIPKNIRVIEPLAHIKKAARLGGIATYNKYGFVGGSPEKRKIKWQNWWKTIGKFKPHPILNRPLSFKKPKKSKNLAEFIGIMLGDGGMNKRQIFITLHHRDDKQYAKFVAQLMEKLFGTAPSIIHRPKYSVNNLVISRSNLVKFCNRELGLVIGNKIKQQIDIPSWIKENKNFRIACLRGLIDTDGSVFTHRYKVGNNCYQYKKIAFTSLSKPLINSVYKIMKKDVGLKPRLARNKDVRLESKKDVKKYFNKVGFHNPKHCKRYKI